MKLRSPLKTFSRKNASAVTKDSVRMFNTAKSSQTPQRASSNNPYADTPSSDISVYSFQKHRFMDDDQYSEMNNSRLSILSGALSAATTPTAYPKTPTDNLPSNKQWNDMMRSASMKKKQKSGKKNIIIQGKENLNHPKKRKKVTKGRSNIRRMLPDKTKKGGKMTSHGKPKPNLAQEQSPNSKFSVYIESEEEQQQERISHSALESKTPVTKSNSKASKYAAIPKLRTPSKSLIMSAPVQDKIQSSSVAAASGAYITPPCTKSSTLVTCTRPKKDDSRSSVKIRRVSVPNSHKAIKNSLVPKTPELENEAGNDDDNMDISIASETASPVIQRVVEPEPSPARAAAPCGPVLSPCQSPTLEMEELSLSASPKCPLRRSHRKTRPLEPNSPQAEKFLSRKKQKKSSKKSAYQPVNGNPLCILQRLFG